MAGLVRERRDCLRAGRQALALGAAAWLLASGALPAAAQPDSGRSTIATVAGMGRYNGDGQSAKNATLTMPFGQSVMGIDGQPFAGLAVDLAGNLFISDRGNNRVRKVSVGPDGTTLTGTISTVAGNGALATAGDGGPAREATLRSPRGVAVDQAGRLLIADTENNRVRLVTPAS